MLISCVFVTCYQIKLWFQFLWNLGLSVIENTTSMERHESCTATQAHICTHSDMEAGAVPTLPWLSFALQRESCTRWREKQATPTVLRSPLLNLGEAASLDVKTKPMHWSIFFFQNILCTEVCTTSWQWRHVCEGGVLCFTANIRAENVTAAKCDFTQAERTRKSTVLRSLSYKFKGEKSTKLQKNMPLPLPTTPGHGSLPQH